MSGELWMRAVKPEELHALQNLAAEDAHEVIAPTDVFTRDGEMIGYACIGSVPLLLPWFHTKRCDARASKYFINQMENVAARMLPPGHCGLICVPVVKESPFQPFIQRLGYTDAGPVNLTFKKVT